MVGILLHFYPGLLGNKTLNSQVFRGRLDPECYVYRLVTPTNLLQRLRTEQKEPLVFEWARRPGHGAEGRVTTID